MAGRILLLGGSGFIGERVVEDLRAQHIPFSAPAHAELDIRDIAALRVALATHDTVVVLTQPDQQGITALAAALALSQPTHIVYASTVLLYGSSTVPQKEDAPLAPATSYEQAKFDEEMALLRTTKHGHTLTVARLGNVYGGAKNRGVVQKALRAMYGGEPLVVAGEHQVRDFIHVGDVAAGFVHLVQVSHGGVFNVTSGRGVTIDQLLVMLEHIAGRGIPWMRPLGGRADGHKDVIGDNRKLAALGFTPRTMFEEGLKQTHELYARSISK